MRLQTMTSSRAILVSALLFLAGLGVGMWIKAKHDMDAEERHLNALLRGDQEQRQAAALNLVDSGIGVTHLYNLFAYMPTRPVASESRIAALVALGSTPYIRDFLPTVSHAAFADDDPKVRMTAVVIMENYYKESVCGGLRIMARTLDKESNDELLQSKLRLLALYTGLDYAWMSDLLKTNSAASLRDVIEKRLGAVHPYD